MRSIHSYIALTPAERPSNRPSVWARSCVCMSKLDTTLQTSYQPEQGPAYKQR
jgi:hypothetical protein